MSKKVVFIFLVLAILGIGGYSIYNKIIKNEHVNELDYSNFIGEFVYIASEPESCGEYVEYYLNIFDDKAFELSYPSACRGASIVKGTIEIHKNTLYLNVTHDITYDEEVQSEYQEQFKIENKDTLILTKQSGEQIRLIRKKVYN